MQTISASSVKEWMIALLAASGADRSRAEMISGQLLEASLCGVDAQGIIRVFEYIDEIRRKTLVPSASAVIDAESETTVKVNGNWGFGQETAWFLLGMLERKARGLGTASGTAHRCNHIGRLYDYAFKAAQDGFISILCCNTEPLVAAFNGTKRVLGTNPIGIGIPCVQRPAVIDMATSMTAAGFVLSALRGNKQLPPGLIIDKNGSASTNPADFFDGGSLLPFGGHKGYSLSFAVDVLAGALSGQGCGWEAKGPNGEHSNGVFFCLVDVSHHSNREQFEGRATALKQQVKATGKETEVMVPGEPEARFREIRLKEGIQLDERTLSDFAQAAKELNVQLKGLGEMI